MPYFPDVPPRDFEIRILKWVGYPLLVLLAVGFQTWACEVRNERKACEQRCASAGREQFIYVPADDNVGRPSECLCPEADAAHRTPRARIASVAVSEDAAVAPAESRLRHHPR